MSALKKEFTDSVDYIKNADNDLNPANDLKLEMYALFKQATEGDLKGKKPRMLDLVGKAKYRAWAKVKGTLSE